MNQENSLDGNVMDVSDMILEDVGEQEKKVPRSEKLAQLTDLVDKRFRLEMEISRAASALHDLEEKFKEVDSMQIPDLFDELGIRKLSLANGRTVEVKLKYAASITEANSTEAFGWLEKNGHDSLIKHKVTVDIRKGENEEYAKLIETLNVQGVSYTDKNTVHPQTLSAFVKEQIESGADFPKELFKVYPLRSTNVK